MIPACAKPFWMRNTNWQRGNISDQRTTVKFLSVKPLAEQNNLAVGDKITLTHAKLGSDDGVYTDLMKEKSAYETVEIKGIYDIKNASDNALNPTAKKAENLIFSDSQLLINLQE